MGCHNKLMSVRKWSHAIRDAMSAITEILRDESGLDGDERSFVGKALRFSKGKPPRISVCILEWECPLRMGKAVRRNAKRLNRS